MTVPSLEALRHFVEQTVLYLLTGTDVDFCHEGVTINPRFKGVITLDDYLGRAAAFMSECIRSEEVGVFDARRKMVDRAILGGIPLVATTNRESEIRHQFDSLLRGEFTHY